MIFDTNAKDLFEQYQAARKIEDVAIKELSLSMKNGNNDMRTLEELSKRMEDAHNRSMDLWDQLHPLRLDK